MKKIYISIVCLTLVSCSSALKIRVDVLDREALRKFPVFSKMEAEQLYAQLKIAWTDSAINAQRFFLKDETKKSLTHDTSITKKDVAPLYKSISKQVDTTFYLAKKALMGYEELNSQSQPQWISNCKD